MTTFTFPSDYSRIRRVGSFHELATTALAGGINALCWERTLAGDFAEVVALLGDGAGIVTVDEARLAGLRTSAEGRSAVEVLVEDQRLLRERDLAPELNLVHGYLRDDASPVPTDVFSFHADRAPLELDTWLCTYHGAPSEGLRNDEACRRVDVPEIRAELLRRYGGEDDRGFGDYLSEHSYDLHYRPTAKARPFSFGVGNLWRVATNWPGCRVPPFLHRAPQPTAGDSPRLLLIS